MKPALPLLLLLSTLAPLSTRAEADGPLGRLFFTPEKRATLDRQRLLNIQETQTLEGATMSLDGIIQRSSGKKTVWINGRPQDDDASAVGVNTRLRPGAPGRALLSPGGEPPVELRVGESINRATREKAGSFDNGSLQVKPPPR